MFSSCGGASGTPCTWQDLLWLLLQVPPPPLDEQLEQLELTMRLLSLHLQWLVLPQPVGEQLEQLDLLLQYLPFQWWRHLHLQWLLPPQPLGDQLEQLDLLLQYRSSLLWLHLHVPWQFLRMHLLPPQLAAKQPLLRPELPPQLPPQLPTKNTLAPQLSQNYLLRLRQRMPPQLSQRRLQRTGTPTNS